MSAISFFGGRTLTISKPPSPRGGHVLGGATWQKILQRKFHTRPLFLRQPLHNGYKPPRQEWPQINPWLLPLRLRQYPAPPRSGLPGSRWPTDRKSTRLHSSHVSISYA